MDRDTYTEQQGGDTLATDADLEKIADDITAWATQ